MTKRERLLKAFNFEKTDRVPIVDWIQHGGLAAVISHREVKHDFWTIEESGKIANKYLDMAQDLTPSFPQTNDQVNDLKTIVDGNEKWYLRNSPDGFRYKRNYWMEAVVGYPVTDDNSAAIFLKKKIEEAEKQLSEHTWGEEKQTYRQKVKKKKELMGDTELLLMTPGGGTGVDTLFTMLGWERFSSLIYDKPDLVSKYLEVETLNIYKRVENFVEGADLQPIALIYCDVASTTGLMLSPEWIRKNMYPSIERLASFYKKNKIRVIYHSEGDIRRIIDDLISIGIEGINPLEKTTSGMSVPEVRKRWPNLVLWGGVDNRDLLVHGTVEDVKQEVEFLLRNYGKDGGLLLGSSGQVHPGCKLDNVVAMYEVALNTKIS